MALRTQISTQSYAGLMEAAQPTQQNRTQTRQRCTEYRLHFHKQPEQKAVLTSLTILKAI